jgi:hypothetical protein
LKAGESVLQIARSPKNHSVATAVELVGDLQIGGLIGAGQSQDQSATENQSLRRGVCSGQNLQALQGVAVQDNRWSKWVWHDRRPCREKEIHGTIYQFDANAPFCLCQVQLLRDLRNGHLVVLSTILCPVTTPLTLLAFASTTSGQYAEALSHLSGQQTGTFLLVCVVIPSLAGLLVRHGLGNKYISRMKPALKIANALVLLFLCYVNAATALPQIVAAPDWDYLAIVLIIVAGLCLSAFSAGWLLARLLKLSVAQQKSLMFGLGMNNNGTGMALASIGLSSMPCAFLPVLTYNLVQHLVAGSVNRIFSDKSVYLHAT